MEHQQIVKKFPDYTVKTIDFCLTFFVLVPAVIYLLSYLPFVDNSHPGLFDRMLTNQTSMFNYHSGLEATHPYSSSWYQWPTMVRPIWYYSGYVTDAVKEGISAFGNPVVWWIGILAFIYILYLLIRNNAFLCSLTGHTQTECSTDTATTPVPQRICSSCFPRSRLPGAVPALVLRHQNYLHLPLFPQHTVCGTDDRVQPDAAEKSGYPTALLQSSAVPMPCWPSVCSCCSIRYRVSRWMWIL